MILSLSVIRSTQPFPLWVPGVKVRVTTYDIFVASKIWWGRPNTEGHFTWEDLNTLDGCPAPYQHAGEVS